MFWLILPLLLLTIAAAIALLFSFKPIPPVRMGWMLALFPLLSFITISWLTFKSGTGVPSSLLIEWIPQYKLVFSLHLDDLSALFALLVTGIGTLVVVYTGYYFEKDSNCWRFFTYLFIFMLAMLGLVLAGDVITLFVFWEITSLSSFFLIAYKFYDPAARRGAFKSLFITAGGGIALLCGLLWVAILAGGSDFETISNHGDVLRSNPYYPAFLCLILFGALTKSAQVPAHIWLPDAMSAPTPASAFLHSATMVKAGIYLLARLNPALGFTEMWFYILTITGLLTMLVGAYLGFKQNDLKGLLAYSTISQLGVMVAMIGQDIEIAFKALVISIVAHALYKSSLFLTTGIIDHETNTRDLRELGGLFRLMPFTGLIAGLATLSMAGLPPMFGFLAKETLLTTSLHPTLPPLIGSLFPWMAVAAGALLLAQAGLYFAGTFLGSKDVSDQFKGVHDPKVGMWIMPAIPAVLSITIGLLPAPEFLVKFLAGAAETAFDGKVKVSLALWAGLSIPEPLILSIIAIGIGIILFVFRQPLRRWLQGFIPGFGFNNIYSWLLKGLDRLSELVVQIQSGFIRSYIVVILTAVGIFLVFFSALPITGLRNLMPASIEFTGILPTFRVFILVMVVMSSLVSVLLYRDFLAILATSVSGLGVAVWIALEPAPDVALVQITVDLLATVILVLSLSRLPRTQREKAHEFTFRQSRPGIIRDAIISFGAGAVMTLIVYISLSSRPHPDLLSSFYAQNAKILTGANDIVGAILVDFRGFDTFFEIAVFAAAGLGIHTLLHYAARRAGDREDPEPPQLPSHLHPVMGIGGLPTSPLLRLLARTILPLALLLSVIQIIYGHDQPGDGFTAGVFTSLAIGFWYVVFGYHETKRQLPWLRPGYLIAIGQLIALLTGFTSLLLGSPFLSSVNYGKMLSIPLPSGFYLSSSFFFELAIFLTVLGGATYIIDNLGRPKELDLESDKLLRQLALNARLDRSGQNGDKE